MLKKEFIKLFEDLGDNVEIVVPSTTQFNGYNTITEQIEILQDVVEGKRIIIIQEKDRLI